MRHDGKERHWGNEGFESGGGLVGGCRLTGRGVRWGIGGGQVCRGSWGRMRSLWRVVVRCQVWEDKVWGDER
jgi:hypothetical protein